MQNFAFQLRLHHTGMRIKFNAVLMDIEMSVMDGNEKRIKDIQDRFFDTTTANERQALDRALTNIIAPFADRLSPTGVSIEDISRVMRRFLRANRDRQIILQSVKKTVLSCCLEK